MLVAITHMPAQLSNQKAVSTPRLVKDDLKTAVITLPAQLQIKTLYNCGLNWAVITPLMGYEPEKLRLLIVCVNIKRL